MLICRLFPVLPGNGRITQKDMIVGGYLIPKGVSYTMVLWKELEWKKLLLNMWMLALRNCFVKPVLSYSSEIIILNQSYHFWIQNYTGNCSLTYLRTRTATLKVCIFEIPNYLTFRSKQSGPIINRGLESYTWTAQTYEQLPSRISLCVHWDFFSGASDCSLRIMRLDNATPVSILQLKRYYSLISISKPLLSMGVLFQESPQIMKTMCIGISGFQATHTLQTQLELGSGWIQRVFGAPQRLHTSACSLCGLQNEL